jgi:SAM-dependent methyltransferase
VHLGNLETTARDIKSEPAEKTRRWAKRFTKSKIIGIDVLPIHHAGERLANWHQIEADFKKGLDSLEDGSISRIDSEVSLGHYTSPKGPNVFFDRKVWRLNEVMSGARHYTADVIRTAHRKLKPGGKLVVAVSEGPDNMVIHGINNSPFEPDKVKIRPLRKKEYQETPWLREARRRNLRMLRVTALK